MYAGRVVEHGPVHEVFAAAKHPYTRALLTSIPRAEQANRLPQIDGTPPGLRQRGAGCQFAPRCAVAVDRCRVEVPELTDVGPDHVAACHVVRQPTAAALLREEMTHASS